MSRALVYGNGKSRLKWNLNQELQDNITTWGCNRIYNDTVVDNLVAVDCHVTHMVYKSGYANNNKCWFANWNILPKEFDVDYMRKKFYDYPIGKLMENSKTEHGCVINGREQEPNQGLYINWNNEKDMVENIEFPKEWSSGTTAVHLACQQGAKEIYLMGFDLSENPLNNVYEELQKHQKLNENQKMVKKLEPHSIWYRSDWANEMKTVMQEFSDTDFIWIEPHEQSTKFDMNNLTYDTYENIRRKICR